MNNTLILGCARSGTSILGEFFECLPGYSFLFEPQLVPRAYRAAIDTCQPPIAIKRPKTAPEHAATCTPGLAFDWPQLRASLPEPLTIIWIVRHPFDTICSLRPGILNQWNHSPRPPGWQELQQHPWEIQCANHWANINGVGFAALYEQVHVIKYENLVANPGAMAEVLCQWIGCPLPPPPEAMTWAASVGNRKGSGAYEAKRQDRWSETNHQVRVGRHWENLTPGQRELVHPIVSAVASNFGYELNESPPLR